MYGDQGAHAMITCVHASAEHKGIVLGIDATNLRAGGGLTHLMGLLGALKTTDYGLHRVILWAQREVHDLLGDMSWVEKSVIFCGGENRPARFIWSTFLLHRAALKAGCSVLFVPGGLYLGNFRPVVTMSRNLLPFEFKELYRYVPTSHIMRLALLRLAQSKTFQHADTVIFLTDYARRCVLDVTGPIKGSVRLIPHGVDKRFFRAPRPQEPIEAYSHARPYRILYVSIVDHYKHQWRVVEAVARLRESENWPLLIELVGPAYPPALKILRASLKRFDPNGSFALYRGAVDQTELKEIYFNGDLGVFASSCENMPNILLEKMAAGLPIASSNRGPMPELLQDAGLYFDPEQPDEIAHALKRLISSTALRKQLSQKSYQIAQEFSWERCASQTFTAIRETYNQYKNSPQVNAGE